MNHFGYISDNGVYTENELAFIMGNDFVEKKSQPRKGNYNKDFYINNGVLNEYRGTDTVIKIPANVVSIGKNAFENSNITAVGMGENVLSISEGAFKGCKKLQLVKLNDSLQAINNEAFYGCKNLKFIKLTDKITKIGDRAFYDCRNIEEIVISETVKEIGDEAFAKCSLLFSVTIPEGVKKMGDRVFSRCKDLMDIYLPNSLDDISSECFSELAPDTVVHVHKGSNAELFCLRHRVDFNYDGILDCMIGLPVVIPEYSRSNEFIIDKGLLRSYRGRARMVVVPDGVKKIGEAAFIDNGYIEEVSLPNTLLEIDDRAFTGCTHLRKIDIPQQVNEIGVRAFSECPALKEIVLPTQLKRLKGYVFEKDSSLSKIYVPDSVSSIDRNAFTGCDNIVEITLPARNYIKPEFYLEGKKKVKKVLLTDGSVYKDLNKRKEKVLHEELTNDELSDDELTFSEQEIMNKAIAIMIDVHDNAFNYVDHEKKKFYLEAMRMFKRLPQVQSVKEKENECRDYVDMINCGYYQDALVLLESQNSAMQNMGFILMSNISNTEIERTRQLYEEWLKTRHDVVEQIRKAGDEAYSLAETQIEDLEKSIEQCGVFEIIKKMELRGQLEAAKLEKERIEIEKRSKLEKLGVSFGEERIEGISLAQENVIRNRFPDIKL